MATKYVECALGTIYRDEDPKTGEVRGGPMYYIKKGLGPKWMPMAILFAVFTVFGAFGAGGMFQANQAASALEGYFGVPTYATGILLSILVSLVILGGIKRIGKVASRIVPLMCFIYVLGALYICLTHIDKLPHVLWIIFNDAFTGQAAAGGSIGAVIIMGVRRAVFSNEAGLGSASIAHAAVKTDYPIREGIVASLGPLIDTILVCSATAFIIILSGHYGTEMFKPVDANTLSFERPGSKISLSQGWSTTNLAPKETSKTQTFRHGAFVLQYQPTSQTAVATTHAIPIIHKGGKKFNGQAIRFSCHRNSGRFQVALTDAKNQPIGTLNINKSGDTIRAPDGTPLIGVNGCAQNNHWHSHVISFKNAFKDKALANKSSLNKIRLAFIAAPKSGPWTIDRLQVVDKLQGIELTIASFDKFLKGFGSIFITFAVLLFAYSTMITWSYYGETAAVFAFGKRVVVPFKWVFVAIIFIGSVNELGTVISFSDLAIGLMVIPNTIAILILSPEISKKTVDYFKNLKDGKYKRYH